MKIPELLAPVGEIDSFYAAVENGANAVYVGGKQFSARQYASNLDLSQLEEIIEYAHLRNIKVYITLNTLIKNSEIHDLVKYIHELLLINVDGFIIQDFGIARILKSYFPSAKFHASTQMSAHSTYDVKFLEEAGYKRVVLARELSLDEIETIKNNTNIELETFIHGALCVSYSGQCLMSSMIGGRSGNRGRCAQPCRLPYTLLEDGINITDSSSPYLLSPKDIQTLDLLPRLIEIGVNTFKIEGRMKSPEYVSSVVRNYRKYIDIALEQEDYQVSTDDEDELLSIFNRGGFTKGYFVNNKGMEMMASSSPKNIGLEIGKVISYNSNINLAEIETRKPLNKGDGLAILMSNNNQTGTGISKEIPAGRFTIKIEGPINPGDIVYLSKNHKLNKELEKTYKQNDRKSKIKIYAIAKQGSALEIKLIHENNIEVINKGVEVLEAKNAPLSKEDLEKQISKFGNTPFQVEDIEIDMDDNIYIPIKGINELRRQASLELESKILNSNTYDGQGYINFMEKQEINSNITKSNKSETSASVRNIDQLKKCIGRVDNIYLQLNNQKIEDIIYALELLEDTNSKLYIGLPHILRDNDYNKYKDLLIQIEKTSIAGYLIKTYGQYKMLESSTKQKVIDYTFNIMNNESARYWEEKNIDKLTLSVEMSLDEVQSMESGNKELIVYGHLPVMTSEQCILQRQGKCKSDKEYKIVDRKEKEYPIVTNCKLCRMEILSSKPIIMLDSLKQREILPIDSIRLNFTIESPEKVEEVLDFYLLGTVTHNINGTNGYFKNGVE